MRKEEVGNFLAIQWLKLDPSTAEGAASIPGRGTKILKSNSMAKEKNRKMSFFFFFADNIIAYI